MRQQQQEIKMTTNTNGMRGITPGREIQIVASSQRRVKRLSHRPRFFDSLDDG